MATAKGEVKDFAKEGKSGFNDFAAASQAASGKVMGAIKKATLAIAAAGTALLAIGQQGKEFSQSQAQIKTAFEANGASAEVAKKTYNELYRVLGDNGKATEAALHLGKLTNSEKDLAEWTKITKGVYATFGDSLPIEGLTEAVNHSAKLGEVQGQLADALEWSGISVDDFNDQLFWCNDESEREKLIRDTLNGIYSEAAENYEENNAAVLEQNEAQASLNETLASLYESLTPVMNSLLSLAAEILEPLIPVIEQIIEKIGPGLSAAFEWLGDAIGTVIDWITENWSWIENVLIILGSIAAAIVLVNTALSIYNGVMAIVAVVTNAAIAPYLLVIAAVAAVIAIVILCIKYWDEIVAALKIAWDKICEIWSVVAGWFSDNVIKPIKNFFADLWSGIKNAASNAWNGIKDVWNIVANWFNSTIIQPVKNFFSGMWDGLKNGASKAWEGVKSVFSKVGTFFKDTFSNAWQKVKDVFSAGGKIFDGIKDGIVNGFKTVVNAIIRGINKVVALPFNGLNSVLDKISSVEIAGLRPFSFISWRATVPEIPQLATGGITNGATLAMIGERGKEAVLPLENNTEWMDLLASRIVALTGDGTPIYLTVDGKVFAQTVLKTVNANTKQTGKLGLVLA